MIIRNAFMAYFSLTQFEKLYQSFNEANLNTLYESLDKFLIYNDLIKPFNNEINNTTIFGYYWDKYINDTIEDYQKKKIFDCILNKSIQDLQDEKNKYESYVKFTNKISTGNFEPFELNEDLYDFESGEILNLQFINWEPFLINIAPLNETESKNSSVRPSSKY